MDERKTKEKEGRTVIPYFIPYLQVHEKKKKKVLKFEEMEANEKGKEREGKVREDEETI